MIVAAAFVSRRDASRRSGKKPIRYPWWDFCIVLHGKMFILRDFFEKKVVGDVGRIGSRYDDAAFRCQLSDGEFARFSRLIHDVAGIKLPPVKKTMLDGRLRKRLRAVGAVSFAEYFDYLASPEGQELELHNMLDAVSTNKTDFFREPKHFQWLSERVLPEIRGRARNGRQRRIRLWSAGCSTGKEPYTLAMVLAEFCDLYQDIDYSILATDISTAALAKARLAIYEDYKIEPVPVALRNKYLLRGDGDRQGYHRVAPRLRRKVDFRRLNFMDAVFDIDAPLDIIFCRNVIIYFDKQTQAELFKKFYRHLAPGGYLFIGHSESLLGIDGKMRRIAPTIFQKK